MKNPNSSNVELKDSPLDEDVYRRQSGGIDLPTVGVILLVVLTPPLLGWAQHVGKIHVLWSVLLATLAMNYSFTAWHEAAHGNFSKYKSLNIIIGVLSSFASVYPGYFARRREHLIHHRWEGIEGMDPVYPRIQHTSVLLFPLHLFYVDFIKREPSGVPASFLPYTSGQRWADRCNNLFAALLIGYCLTNGFAAEILAVWVVPRGVIFLLNAYYICLFPHYRAEGGFEVYRIVSENPVLWLLTLGQTYHGIHHRWPFIPWHSYRDMAKSAPGKALFKKGS